MTTAVRKPQIEVRMKPHIWFRKRWTDKTSITWFASCKKTAERDILLHEFAHVLLLKPEYDGSKVDAKDIDTWCFETMDSPKKESTHEAQTHALLELMLESFYSFKNTDQAHNLLLNPAFHTDGGKYSENRARAAIRRAKRTKPVLAAFARLRQLLPETEIYVDR